MTAAIFAYSRTGCQTARRVLSSLGEASAVCYTLPRLEEPDFLPLEPSAYQDAFSDCDALIFVGACGIAVRKIAPFIRDKKTDPAVVVIDERANFVIPLLSGHIGGANRLAVRLADALGAVAAVTTATDVNGKFAVDAWAAEHDCAISDMQLAKAFAAAILERDLPLCSAFPVIPPLAGGIVESSTGALGVYIGCDRKSPYDKTLQLIPKKLHVGVGCRKGISQAAVETAIFQVLEDHALDPRAILGVYSIDLKKDEQGLLSACAANGWPFHCYSAQELREVSGEFTGSAFVASVTGVDNVCERAALRGAESLLIKKTALGGVTVAVAIEHWEVRFG